MVVQMPDINLGLMMPELVLSLAAMVLLLLTAWSGKEEGRGTIGLLAVAAVVAAALLNMLHDAKTATTFGGLFVSDAFAIGMKLLMCVATALPLLMAREYMKHHDIDSGEYYVLTLFALVGGMLMASAADFIMLYLGIELMSLSIYILAAYKRDDAASNEAGLKYFILGSMASGILLYGITLVYGASGSTSLKVVSAAFAHAEHGKVALQMGMVLVLAGLGFKVAAAPFHMWAPDVYQGAPTSVTAFMAAMPKVAAFAGIFRVLLEAFGPAHVSWGPILQLLAVVSLAVGAVAAIAQTNIKRMLAYSSIGHVGYALIGLTAVNDLGHQAVVLYLAIYIFMNLGTFAVILLLDQAGLGEEITDYKGLSQKRPGLAFVMALFMFSMAGVPPLAGFIGKLYIFMAAVKANLIPLAVLGVFFSAIGAFYYLRIVKFMYFDPAEGEQAFAAPVGLYSGAVLTVSLLAVLVWGIFPGALLAWSKAAVLPFQ